MSIKLDKLRSEREKNTTRISGLQARNKDLDRQITDLENTEILGLVKSVEATPEELAEFIKEFRDKNGAPISIIKQEDTDNEE